MKGGSDALKRKYPKQHRKFSPRRILHMTLLYQGNILTSCWGGLAPQLLSWTWWRDGRGGHMSPSWTVSTATSSTNSTSSCRQNTHSSTWQSTWLASISSECLCDFVVLIFLIFDNLYYLWEGRPRALFFFYLLIHMFYSLILIYFLFFYCLFVFHTDLFWYYDVFYILYLFMCLFYL